MAPQSENLVAVTLLVLLLCLGCLLVGIHLGQSGVTRVGRGDRNEFAARRKLRDAAKLVGVSSVMVTDIVDEAIEHMRELVHDDAP